jgi:cell division protein FtsB
MKKLLSVLSNKFFLTILAFGAWMIYFDQNDWMAQQERKKELQGLNDNITYLSAEIAKMETDFNGIKTSPAVLEKYAREQYRMKRENEDIYIFE